MTELLSRNLGELGYWLATRVVARFHPERASEIRGSISKRLAQHDAQAEQLRGTCKPTGHFASDTWQMSPEERGGGIDETLALMGARSKDGSALRMPGKVIVELTRSCNLNCVMCVNSTGEGDPPRTMPLGRFRAVAERLFPAAHTVRLNGLGESTAIPDFMEYLAVLKDYRCKWELVTNLTCRDDALWRELMRQRFRVLVSCDAASPEIYQSIRRGARFSDFEHNLYLIGGAVAPNRHRYDLHCIFTLMANNIDELPRVVTLMASAGIHRVIVNVVHDKGDATWLAARQGEILAVFAESRRLASDAHISLRFPDHLGESDVEGDQEDIRHGKLAQNVERRECHGPEQPELHEGKAKCFEIGCKEREDGDNQSKENIRPPERLKPRDHRDFAELEQRKQTRFHQRGEPGHGEEDEQGQIGKA